MLRKIQFAFTGFILSFKTSLITNRMHMELITGARGGLIFGKKHNTCIETLVYNWGPYKWRGGGGGGELIIGCYASYFSQAP